MEISIWIKENKIIEKMSSYLKNIHIDYNAITFSGISDKGSLEDNFREIIDKNILGKRDCYVHFNE